MKEDFDLVERMLVFTPTEADAFLKQLTANGADAQDGQRTVRTILLTWDDTEHTRVRAASYPETIQPVVLKDGRVMVSGLWSKKGLAAVGRAEVVAVELTKPQIDDLLPAYPVAAIAEPVVDEIKPVN